MTKLSEVRPPHFGLTESAAPATPAAGEFDIYAATDGTLHSINDAAVDTEYGAPAPFKFTLLNGNGDKTTTSGTKTPIDSTNLAFLTLAGLSIGDIVRCTLSASFGHSSSAAGGFDFEVDQPTSANTYIGAGADYGLGAENFDVQRQQRTIVGMFTVTEAGTHGFRPAWLVDAATLSCYNAASGNNDSTILFSVEDLGPVTA